MLSTHLLRLAAILAALLMAAPAARAQIVEGIAAVVNDEPITTLDVRDRMRLILFSAGVEPSEDILAQVLDQALRGLIEESIQLQTADQFDLEVEEREIDDALSNLAQSSGESFEALQRDLAEAGVPIGTLRRQVRAEIAWQILTSGRFRQRIRVSDRQIETAMERLVASAQQQQFRMLEVLIETPSGSGGEEQAANTIRTIYALLDQEDVPFQALAQQFSAAPSATVGGDTGYVTAASVRPQVLEVVQQMPPGSISNPIRVPGGHMIVALIDRREGRVIEQLNLYQATVPNSRITDASRPAMTRAASRLSGCDDVSGVMSGVEGVIVSNLGSVAVNALVPQIRDAVRGLEPGQATSVLETGAGLQVFVLCGRELTGPGVPTTQEVERQLIDQQLSLLGRRWLRDLRREATVDIRDIQ
ncbi:MAG: peptidylprolyl isomerase [Oceanicaulis sp.]|nr:peptidylprolyl isomerase [Oceanicaulis sp.]